MTCAEHERNKEQLLQQASQITGLENAKSWLERRLHEAEVCLFFFFCYIQLYLVICCDTIIIIVIILIVVMVVITITSVV